MSQEKKEIPPCYRCGAYHEPKDCEIIGEIVDCHRCLSYPAYYYFDDDDEDEGTFFCPQCMTAGQNETEAYLEDE
jgi:predicted nucleotidyltransferase